MLNVNFKIFILINIFFIANNSLGNPSKNISTGINYAKYRSPSPSSVGKPSSTIMMGSIKSVGIKNKWK